MSMLSGRSGFALAFALAALWLGAPCARAQDNPVPYWTTAWPTGFGSGFATGQSANIYTSLSGANLSALDGSSATNGGFSSRFDLPNGWFVGSERGGTALTGPGGAWNNMPSLSYEGTQVGYNFTNVDLPVSIYAGFGTLKYNNPIGSPFAGLDSMSSSNSAQGYSAHAGVEFRPTSNLSLSFGASFTQQPTDPNSAFLPGASPFAFGARR
jgi:opacity protein-like surface antigen